jgi:hypothetical protein
MNLSQTVFHEALTKSPSFVQSAARSLFDPIDAKLDPQVILLAVPWDRASKTLLAATEISDCSIEWFDGIRDTLDETPLSYLESLAPDVRGVLWQQKVSIKVALWEIFNDRSDELGCISFPTFPEFVQGYSVSMVLLLDQAAVDALPSLSRNAVRPRPQATSLVHEAAVAFVRGYQPALGRLSQGLPVLSGSGTRNKEILREAGFWLMRTPEAVAQCRASESLFHSCNEISSLFYESTEGTGTMVISRQGHQSVEQSVTLRHPVRLDSHRAIRKLLQMNSDDTQLLCDTRSIYGLGKYHNLRYRENREDLFVVEFTGHLTWRLVHAGNELMCVSYGEPGLARRQITEEEFTERARREFRNLADPEVAVLWRLVSQTARQEHGTMIVISDNARTESARLANQATPLEPVRLSPELVLPLSAVDGAIIVSPDATCHAVGVILDGIASDRGDSARGARYNSAIRYLEYVRTQGHSCLIIVVSEDGTVDLL